MRDGKATTVSVTRRANVLHDASIERMEDTELLFESRRWVLSMYAAGVAVESLLQAFAIRSGRPYDANHDLRLWLAKCPHAVITTIKGSAIIEWSDVTETWDNTIRYMSTSGLLGFLKERRLNRKITLGKFGEKAVVKVNAAKLLRAAKVVHGKGLVLWQSQ